MERSRSSSCSKKSRAFSAERENFQSTAIFLFSRHSTNPADQINPFLYFSVGQAGHSKKKTSANFSSKIIREIFNFLFSLVKKFAIFLKSILIFGLTLVTV
jgi:hypothetical protein